MPQVPTTQAEAGVRPRDVVGKTRRRLDAELIVELEGIDKKISTVSRGDVDPPSPRPTKSPAGSFTSLLDQFFTLTRSEIR